MADPISPRRAAGFASGNASRLRKSRTAQNRAPETARFGDAAVGDIAEQAARLGISIERVLVEYARIAFADIRQVLTWGPDGVLPKPPAELGDAEAAAIREIVPGARPGTIRVKFYDKKAALDAIARHLGMFPAPPRRREETPMADPAEDVREVLARRLARLAAGDPAK